MLSEAKHLCISPKINAGNLRFAQKDSLSAVSALSQP